MSSRPLSPNEIAYLKRYKGTIDASLQALWITLGLLALPVVFFWFTFRSAEGDRLALIIAGAILLALLGAVVYYSAREHHAKKLKLTDAALFKGLVEDLVAKTATEEQVVVTAKETKVRPEKGPEGGARKEYWLVAGDRRFQVSAGTYMATAVDQAVRLAYATHSRVVLTVDDERERLALATAREPIEMPSYG
ncbi:MAG: hypothetical protein ACLGIN_13100 [Candidatus Sericytochromatia bacterium]